MSLSRLVFDSTNANTRADSSNVGAWVRAGTDGTVIGSTNVSGSDGLNAYILNTSLTVTATNLDIRDLVATSDSVAISDGTDTLAVNGDGSINSVVTATNLDIRDLTHTADSVRLGDGTVLNTITVAGAKNALDVNIAASDIEINVENDWANIAVQATAQTIPDTVGGTNMVTSTLANRRFAWFRNNSGGRIIYVGASGVTTSSGFPLAPNETLHMRLGPAVNLFGIAPTGGSIDVRTLQAS